MVLFPRIVAQSFLQYQGFNVSSAYLPAILKQPALFLAGQGRLPPYRVPAQLRPWLLDPGSLTQRLVAMSGGQFEVQLLRQGHFRANAEEQAHLNLGQRQWPFIREVLLLCYGIPWVFARTAIPQETLQGPARALTHLGTKPLGAVLFNHPQVERGPISVQRLAANRVSHWIEQEGTVWGRQSVFTLKNKPLLVSEYFLPAFPGYKNQAPQHG